MQVHHKSTRGQTCFCFFVPWKLAENVKQQRLQWLKISPISWDDSTVWQTAFLYFYDQISCPISSTLCCSSGFSVITSCQHIAFIYSWPGERPVFAYLCTRTARRGGVLTYRALSCKRVHSHSFYANQDQAHLVPERTTRNRLIQKPEETNTFLYLFSCLTFFVTFMWSHD